MTATNHTLTGAIVGLSLHNPILAIPLAFGMHFVLDSLPHYSNKNLVSKKFIKMLLIDMSIASLILLFLLFSQPQYWLLAISCAVACASPDLMWMPNWIRSLCGKKTKKLNNFAIFHSKIQKHESPNNAIYEFVWFLGGMLVLINLL